MKNSQNLDISCRVVFSSNKWHKKEGSPSSFWRKRQLISLNSSVFIENLPSFERARARAPANHAKIDAQKGCATQLNGITLTVDNIPVVPAGTISLKCFTTSSLWEHFACLAKQRVTFLVSGPGSSREA